MPRRRSGRPVSGWLILDKDLGDTSTHAVNVVKRLLAARKAGHAGTLDPLATGILPIAFGEATKTMNFAVDGEKAYRFNVRWGAETSTDDAEGDVVSQSDQRPRRDEIEAVIGDFTGEILQVPPKFSAIKVDGQRAYDLARDGEEVPLAARTVVVKELFVTDQPDADTTTFEAVCGKGTYVRAIARDLGRTLGCYGYVSKLRRTRVGPFSEADAVTLGDLQAASDAARAVLEGELTDAALLPSDAVAAELSDDERKARASAVTASAPALDRFLMPVSAALSGLYEFSVASSDAGRIKRGQSVLLRGRDAPVVSGQAYATERGRLLALGEIEAGSFIPTRVFNL